MAVTAAQLPKSQPDVAKINGFGGCIVTVTRHTGPKNTVGTSIISSKTMSKEALLALPDQLPAMAGAGPGYYNFNVTDAAGSGDDSWLVKLGPDLPPQQETYMAGPGSNGTTPSNGFTSAPNVPMDGAAVTQILPGWFYNSALGLLYTPWRETVSWSQGEPLPKAPAHAQQQQPAFPTPNASPWGPQPGQWGGYPVNDDSSKTKQLEAQIAELKRDREMSDLRADQRRQQEETNKRIDAQADLTRQMFEKLTDALTKKPSGPSDELLAIRAQNEKLERQLEQDRRDAQAREAAAQTREEMRQMKADTDRMIQSLTANKADPMLPMLMQVMQTGNQNAMEAIKAIQSTTTNANTATERQVNMLVEQLRGTITSPVQMMQMMQSARGDGAEMAKMMLETTKDTMAMQRNVFEQLLEASSSGGQPPWLQAVQAAMDKIGPIGAAIAERAGQPKVVVQRVAVPVDAQGRPFQPQATAMAGAPAQAQVAAAPAAAAAEAPAKRGRKPKPAKGQPPMTLAQIRDADPDELAEMLKAFDDETFFGETLFGLVKLVRENVGKGMLPEQVAGGLWDRRLELKALTPVPMAVELLMAEQIDVLIERLLPDVDDAFHNTVVGGIEERIAAEAEGAEE